MFFLFFGRANHNFATNRPQNSNRYKEQEDDLQPFRGIHVTTTDQDANVYPGAENDEGNTRNCPPFELGPSAILNEVEHIGIIAQDFSVAL